MKDYHRILEIPTGATLEQIRIQYKRLVRVYHPDRFTNSQDKLYVEEKLKEITEAYHALAPSTANSLNFEDSIISAINKTQTVGSDNSPPQPIIQPTILNFGEVPKGERLSLMFQVQNEGGLVKNLQIQYSDNHSWFKVAKGRRTYRGRAFPMEFSVVADTSKLQIGNIYNGWIQVRMDETAAQVALTLKVARRKPSALFTSRITLAISLVALLLILIGMQTFDILLPIFSQSNNASVATIPADLAIRSIRNPSATEREQAAISSIASVPPNTPTTTTVTPLADMSPTILPTPILTADKHPTSARDVPLLATSSSPTSHTADESSVVIANHSGIKVSPSQNSNAPLPPLEYWRRRIEDATGSATSIVTEVGRLEIGDMLPITNTEAISRDQTAQLIVTPIPTMLALAMTPIEVPKLTPNGSLSFTYTSTAIVTFAPSLTTVPSPTSSPTSSLTSTPTSTSTPNRTPTQLAIPTYTAIINTATPTNSTSPTPPPSSTYTPTVSPTTTPLATATATFTEAPTPTFTSIPTPAVADTAVVIIPDTYNVNARNDISTEADVVQVLISGTQWIAVGRTLDNAWLLVHLGDGRFAWVFTTTVLTDSRQVNRLPIAVPDSYRSFGSD